MPTSGLDPDPGPSDKHKSIGSSERFARLYAQYQQELYRYIMLLTGTIEDANDVLQETAVVLLQKIEQYEPDRPFMPWARKIAYYEVLKHRTASARRMPLLDERVFEQIASQVESMDPLLDARREALRHCLQKLPVHQLDVIRLRYSEGITPQDISHLTSRPVQTVYTQLKRARQFLLECIERTIRQGARS